LIFSGIKYVFVTIKLLLTQMQMLKNTCKLFKCPLTVNSAAVNYWGNFGSKLSRKTSAINCRGNLKPIFFWQKP